MARTTNSTSSEPKAPDFLAWHVANKGNPVSGLAMAGGVDNQGNHFGTNHHSQHMSSSITAIE